MESPNLIDLGGLSARQAAGSDWLAAVNFCLNAIAYTFVLIIAKFFFDAAAKSFTLHGRRTKTKFGVLFVVGGFSAFGIRLIMTFYAVWGLYVVSIWFTILLMISLLNDLRHLRIVFARSEAAVKVEHKLNNVLTGFEELSKEEIRNELTKVSKELNALSHSGA